MGRSWDHLQMQEMRAFFRANPQVLVLLIICLVLGLGTFLAVMLGLITAGSDKSTGQPSGVIVALQVLTGR
jgi:hypothetical protein